MTRWWLAFGFAVPLSVGGCDDHVLGHGSPIGINCQRDPPLTWENTGDGLIGSRCRACHSVNMREAQRAGAPPDANFDTWDDTLLWAEQIVIYAVDTESMPPAGGMTPQERAKLAEWMRCEVLPALGEVELEGTKPEAGP